MAKMLHMGIRAMEEEEDSSRDNEKAIDIVD